MTITHQGDTSQPMLATSDLFLNSDSPGQGVLARTSKGAVGNASSTPLNLADEPLLLGGDGSTGATPGFDGLIAEVIIYDDALTTVERDSIECALSSKYGINVSASCNVDPVAVDGEYEVSEDGMLIVNVADGVLNNDSDADVDPLTVALQSGPSKGLLTLNVDGSFTYTPSADFSGVDSFVYEVSDGNGGLATATVTIIVSSTQDQMDAIIANLDTLVSSGDLAEKDADKLIKKLKTAQKELANGRNDKTIKELKRFQTEVQKLVDKGKFPAAVAPQILEATDDTIDAAGVSAPQAASQAIINNVQSLIDAGKLFAKDGKKLEDELSKAIREFNKLHVSHGIDKLEKFIEKVDKLVVDGKLLAAEGQPLRDAANTIINSALLGSPLRAAQFADGRGSAGALTANVLRPIFDQAIAQWYSSEPDAALLGQLNSVTVDIIQLSGRLLGLATSNTIWIDADAGGYGWNVGSTFGTTTMDLMSTVTHEMGHVLGYDQEHGLGVMAATLGVNQRPVQSPALHESLISLYAPLDGSGMGSLTTPTSLDTAIHRSSLDSLDSAFGRSSGLAMKGDASLASRLLSQPIAVNKMTRELGDAKLLGIFDERLLEHNLDDDEVDWQQAVDQAFSELNKPAKA
ncbi:MAG TPA: Ig-like domain-containing protein [Pirellulaceae bacterium]|nr:Ig-like domain-containing protein [Pirellulaceae bacterium]